MDQLASGAPSFAANVSSSRETAAGLGWRRVFARRQGGTVLLFLLFLASAALTRLVLTLASLGEVADRGAIALAGAFLLGALYDAAAAVLLCTPVVLLLAALPRGALHRAWARAAVRVGMFGAIFGLLFLALAEFLFWEEFSARFNFIAVDYLVYTTEVIGNIRESYPMPAILAAIAGISALATWAVGRADVFGLWLGARGEAAARRWGWALAWVLGAAAVAGAVSETRLPRFENNYHRELAKNGLWSLFAAFNANEIDYAQFYPTMPTDAAFHRLRGLLGDDSVPAGAEPHDLLRTVVHPGPERRLNVIQITVESLSASFLGHYGNAEGITPVLDALAPKALVFDRFYATGNRTDRGMEALTLSVPPTPGRSLVKRPNNEHLFTLGSVFRSRGYDTAFLYGGYGYFDNMNHFFGENGYRIVDRAAVPKRDVTFANAWGACDGDLYRWTLREADAAFASGRPFFHFVMTTSNHRPYTFPDDEIDLPSKVSGRAGAVKYTDHAIGEFLENAASRPWFRDTMFVIVADHCASSAGRTELPADRYHVPLIIYAPGGQVATGRVATLCSQIDFAPTLLGLLGWSYPSRFYGRDVLAPDAPQQGRALIGTYQKLGLLVDRPDGPNLAVLAPVRDMSTFRFDAATGSTEPTERDSDLIANAIAYYETASFLFSHGRQSEYAAPAP